MGCGGSKSQQTKVIPLQGSKDNVLDNHRSRQGSSKSIHSKQRTSVASLQKKERRGNGSACNRRSKQSQVQVEETPVQTFKSEPEDEEVISKDVDEENDGELIKNNCPTQETRDAEYDDAEKDEPTNADRDEATPMQVISDETSQREEEKPASQPDDNEELNTNAEESHSGPSAYKIEESFKEIEENMGTTSEDIQNVDENTDTNAGVNEICMITEYDLDDTVREIEHNTDTDQHKHQEKTYIDETSDMGNNEDLPKEDINDEDIGNAIVEDKIEDNENLDLSEKVENDNEVDTVASLMGGSNEEDSAQLVFVTEDQSRTDDAENSNTLDVGMHLDENNTIEVADSGVDEDCHEEERLTPESKIGGKDDIEAIPVKRSHDDDDEAISVERDNKKAIPVATSNEECQDEITIDNDPSQDNLQQAVSSSVQNEIADETKSDVTSVTATSVAVLAEVVTDVENATITSKLMGEMIEAIDMAEKTGQEIKCNELNVFLNQIIHVEDRKINDEISTRNEKYVEFDAGVEEVPTQVEKTRDTDDQIKFNQAIRAYCRLVDPDALKAIATPGVTGVCLERALPCNRDVFTHILANIGKLKVLDLSGNHIGPQSFRAIILALTNNKTLKLLNLSNNKTDTQCSESLGMMLSKNDTLEGLDLSSNQLGRDFFSRSVGPAMALNSTLKVLRCASCGFADLSVLIDSLSVNSSLIELDFSHNHIVNGTEFGEKLAVLISKSTSLSILNLKATNVSAEGMQAVQKSLEVNTALTKLNIGGNQMLHCSAMLQFLITCIHHVNLRDLSLEDTTYKDVHKIFDDITTGQVEKSNLTHLNLSNCGLVDSMIHTLVGLMPGCLSGLQLLNVASNSELTSERIKEFAQLTSGDGGKSNLDQLIYGVNEAENLPFGLSQFRCLSSLDLRKCQISTSSLVQVAFFLDKPDGIASLCLDGQKLSGSDVLQVILSSGQDNSLESLSLIGCALNDEDLEPITLALRAGLGLKSLKLAANRITDRSIGEIVEAFVSQEICVIEYINIANNKISCEGASQIARLLTSCSALHTLLVSSNSIGADGLRAIVGCVKPDSSLRLLDLKAQANPIDEEDMEEILTVLAQSLGYTLEKNEYGQVSMATNSLVTVHQDLTVLLTNLGGMTGEMGRVIESSAVRTDYSQVHWPYLGLEEMLELCSVLKGHSPSGKISLTETEWNLIIGEGKDPCVPSWLQIDSHRDCAVYLVGLPASVSANRIEGDLDSEADCVITEVCIMKDPILQKPNGLCWILMSDADSVEKAVKLYESGQARLFNQPYKISRLNVWIIDADTTGIEDKAQEEMERRAKQRDAEDEEHRALLEKSFAASKARHEYTAANPAYADGRIW